MMQLTHLAAGDKNAAQANNFWVEVGLGVSQLIPRPACLSKEGF